MDQPKQGKILQRIQKLRQELVAVTDQQGILASKINQKRVSRNKNSPSASLYCVHKGIPDLSSSKLLSLP